MAMGSPVHGIRAPSVWLFRADSVTDPSVIWHPSPNFGDRRGGARPDMVVIHYTAMPDCGEALARLCAPEHEVSSHYLIRSDGAVFQLVDEAKRAWHAGRGAWGSVTDVNSRSIGIELDNPGDQRFGARKMAALEALLTGIMDRWQIRPERIIGHADMAPARKSDPGPHFPWPRLAAKGLAIWPGVPAPGEGVIPTTFAHVPHAELPLAVDGALRRFGYTDDVRPADRLAAFRMRFRPHFTGPVDEIDLDIAQELAARFPAL